MARRAAQARRRRQMLAGLGAIVAVVVLVGVGWFLITTFWPSSKAEPSAQPSDNPNGCVYAKDPNPPPKGARNVGIPSTTNVPRTGTQKVTMTTTSGVVEFTLDTAKAPCTVNSFTFLASKKYFDATPCHRLLASGVFVLQCGDPSGTGFGGPGYQFGTENLPSSSAKPTYPKGTVAMAKGEAPDSTGSQFFLVYRDSAFPPDYTIFGKITKGLDILEKVGAGGVTGEKQDTPKTKVQISSVAVTPPA